MSFNVRRLRDDKEKKESAHLPWKSIVKTGIAFGGPLLALGRNMLEKREEKKRYEHRLNMLKRIIIILIALLCATLVFAGAVRALVSLNVLSMSSIASVAGTELPTDLYGHTNILLLGQGDEGHDGVDLTDTIMIASLDPKKTGSTVMLSLPRDLYFLETATMGEGRINTFYRDEKARQIKKGLETEMASENAMRMLADEIGRSFGVDIHHIIKVDFIGFVQAVDAIGGIDIVVPENLVDTEYPGPNYTYETFAINAGPQHIDGETALKYARTRHSSSDFARSARQQQILKAIADKMQSEGILTKPRQIMDLLGIMDKHVETTLSVRDMVSLADTGKNMDKEKLLSVQLNTSNGLYGSFSEWGGLLYTPPRDQFKGASVLLPVSIPEFPVTWDRIRLLVDLLFDERAMHAEKAPITILNAGAAPGSAGRLGGELIRFAINVISTENAPEKRTQPTSKIIGYESSITAKRLSELLRIPLSLIPDPSTSSASPTSDEENDVRTTPLPITIELGEDFEYSPLTLLDPSSSAR